MKSSPISIIGAGIGGLTMAIALQQQGFKVDVFEAAPEFKPVGAGISLGINASQVLKELGLWDELCKKGHKLKATGLGDARMYSLAITPLAPLEERFGVANIMIHRADLMEILVNAAGRESIHLRKRLSGLEQDEERVHVDFDDGSSHQSPLLIAADGIHSACRQFMGLGNHLRDAKQACWRGIVRPRNASWVRDQLIEYWGRGARIGFARIDRERIYWYAVADSRGLPNKLSRKELLDLFGDFHRKILDLLAETPDEAILRNDLFDLRPLNTWHRDRVVLIGDAAHATTPNMGQGACQAIEDAHVLPALLSQHSYSEAFQLFEGTRKVKALQVVARSWQIGKMAQIDSRILCSLRNLALRLSPKSAMKRQLIQLYQLEDIPLASNLHS